MANDDITAWLDSLGLINYAEKFLIAGYFSLQQCLTLSKADFSSIGVTKPGHVCRLIRDLQKLKANSEPENSCSQSTLLFLPPLKTAKNSSPMFSKGETKVASSENDEILPPPLPPRSPKIPLKLFENGNYDKYDDISPPPLPKRTIVVPPPPPPLDSSDTDDEGTSLVTESPCARIDNDVDVTSISKLTTQQVLVIVMYCTSVHHVCVYIHVCMYVCILCVCLYMCVCIFMYLCVCMRACI